ncbi:MAG: hypothetical protein IPP48_04755 [Chitinophagaceae bacterium]|nr:hypothetical protein [Chitinophagaceae bacterium]
MVLKRFSLAGEILYTPFSYKSNFMEGIDANGNIVGTINKHKINYLNIPITFNYKIDLYKAKLKFGVGSSFNIVLGNKALIKETNTSFSDISVANTKGASKMYTAFYLHRY